MPEHFVRYMGCRRNHPSLLMFACIMLPGIYLVCMQHDAWMQTSGFMHAAYAHAQHRCEINPTTGNRRCGKTRFSGSLCTKIMERYTCMHGKSFLAACLCGRNEKQQCFCKGRSLSSRDREPACPFNKDALNTCSRDSFQPSPCLQATLDLATVVTQIQATALRRKKNEGAGFASFSVPLC